MILGLALARAEPSRRASVSTARVAPGSETVATEAGTLAAIPYLRAVTDCRDRASHERSARATALSITPGEPWLAALTRAALSRSPTSRSLDEGMTQGKLRLDLVPVPSPLSLPQHVALLDQLGQNPVGGALGDPDRGGDVAQADSRVMGHARKDVGVVGQKVPAGVRCPRTLLHVSRSCFHESMIHCVY